MPNGTNMRKTAFDSFLNSVSKPCQLQVDSFEHTFTDVNQCV